MDRSKPCLFTFFHRLAQAENKCKQMDFEQILIITYFRLYHVDIDTDSALPS